MNYELARALKDAGFPQGNARWIYPGGVTVGIPADSDPTGQAPYVPTLEELIEACGDDLSRIWRIKEGEGYPRWCATGMNDFVDEMADTPTEAVAKFWLALQKH